MNGNSGAEVFPQCIQINEEREVIHSLQILTNRESLYVISLTP